MKKKYYSLYTEIKNKILDQNYQAGEKLPSKRVLADKMGYANKSTIARIESGIIDVPQSKVVKFAEVMGVTVGYLMDWEQEQKKPTIEDDELSDNMKKLIDFAKSVPEDKVELVLKVMKSIVEAD
jgi:DNA-binding transcriptional MocR family regulator